MKQDNIVIKNVRLSFPQLFKAKAFSADQEPKFSAAFILDKEVNEQAITAIKKAIEFVKQEKWGQKVPKGIKICLRDGSERPDTDGYGADVMFINANSSKAIPIVDRDLTPLDATSAKIYAGCYVNASLRLWAQDNDFGKRINANLRAVQFVRDGDAFGEKPVEVSEVFEEVSDDADEDLL